MASQSARLAPIAVLLLVALAAVPAAADPEHSLGGNSVTSIGRSFEAHASQRLAQSFRFDGNTSLTRIALNLSDAGADGAALMTIRPDAGGVPGPTVLATAPVDAGPEFRWVDISLSGGVPILGGASYWIVLSDGNGPGNGHLWWNSDYDANVTGAGAQEAGTWAPLVGDFAFLLFGHVEPNLTLSLSSSTDVAMPGRVVTVDVSFQLSAAHGIANAWLNVTWPVELTFFSDGLAGTGLSAARTLGPGRADYGFTNLPVGSHTFPITFDVDPGSLDGSLLPVAASMGYFASNGSILQAGPRNHTFHVVALDATMSALALDPWAVPGSAIHYQVELRNGAASNPLSAVRFEVTRRENVTFGSASPGGTCTADGCAWSAGDIPGNSVATFLANATMDLGLEPGAVAGVRALIAFTYNGSELRLLDTTLQSQAQVPRISVDLRVSTSLVRGGDAFAYEIRVTNSGTGPASHVWINDTLDQRLAFQGENSQATDFAILGLVLSWHFDGFPAGTERIDLNVSARSLLQDQAKISNLVAADYMDGLERRMPRAFSNLVNVEIAAPNIAATVVVGASQAQHGDLVVEDVTIRNTGRDTSRFVRITQNLGTSLRFVDSDGPSTPTLANSVLTWQVQDLGAQATVAFSVTFQVINPGPEEAVIGFSVAVQYADRNGNATATVLSANVELVRVLPPTMFLSLANPWFLALIAFAIAASGLGGARYAHGKTQVQDVFLVRKDGILIAYRSREEAFTGDADTFSAMFTAIQDFVRVSFQYHEGRQLQALSFGDLQGAVVRGSVVFLAVVFRGRPGLRFRPKLERILKTIEAEHGAFLARWDGDRSQIEKVDALLDPILRTKAKPRRRRITMPWSEEDEEVRVESDDESSDSLFHR